MMLLHVLPIVSLLASTSLLVEAFVPPVHCSSSTSNTARRAVTMVTPVADEDVEVKLSTYPEIPANLVDYLAPQEWEQRCSLAVSYRIAYLHNWHENIFNHITLKVAGSDAEPDGPHFLLNDFGLGFDEITACNLLKVNLDGMLAKQGKPLPVNRRNLNTGKGRVFKPGYVLHSAIHVARDDVHAVWHGHDIDATAVSQTKFGLLPLSQESAYCLNKGVAYHPFEGSANDLSEQPRLVKNLGQTSQILILEDHGPIVACPTIEEAFAGMYFLTRACKYQVKSLSAAGGDLSKIHMPNDELLNEMVRRMKKFDEAPSAVVSASTKPTSSSDGGKEEGEAYDTSGLMFAYARRSAENQFGKDSIYR